MDSEPTDVLLFSYGTLQHPDVQRDTFGRLLEGTADSLPGYRLDPLPIDDAELIALIGGDVHIIARATGDPADRIDEVVLRLTSAEIAASDAYEVAPYTRVAVTLASGTPAFAYVAPPRGGAA